MNRGSTSQIFTGAYSMLRATGILESKWANRAYVSSYFLYKRFWEDPFHTLIERRPEVIGDGNVLDIGANIGYTACLFARAIKPGRAVYAFEPDQATFRTLTDTIQRRRLGNAVVAVNAAVGDADGTLEFWHNQDHAADHRVATEHFKESTGKTGGLDGSQVTRVNVVSVDSFVELRRIDAVSFIKIDVQGFEPAVCQGMERTLARFPDVNVCCEYSPDSFAELGFDPAAVLDFFERRGMQAHILRRSGISAVNKREEIVLAVREEGYVDLLYSRRRAE